LKREIDSGSKDAPQKDGSPQTTPHEEKTVEEFEDDGKWYIGKASEDFRRRRQGEAPRAVATAEEDDDPVQVGISSIISSRAFLSSNKVGTREKERRKRTEHRFWS
jgi:hypothetical protein